MVTILIIPDYMSSFFCGFETFVIKRWVKVSSMAISLEKVRNNSFFFFFPFSLEESEEVSRGA